MALPSMPCSPELRDALRRPTLRWVQAKLVDGEGAGEGVRDGAELQLVEDADTGIELAEKCQGPDPSLLLFFASRNLCYLIVWCPEALDTTAKVRGAGCGCGA